MANETAGMPRFEKRGGEVGAPCNGATPEECCIREIRTYGSMRGRRS